MKKCQIAVVGSAGPEEYAFEKPKEQMFAAAELIGKKIAQKDCITVCGGKGGIMLAVAKGAKQAGGMTAGETSGVRRYTSNEYIDIEIVTGDVAFRGPSQLVGMSDAVIALGGGAGTLQELCVAYRMQKPVVLLRGYGGWADRIAGMEWLDERRLIKFLVANTPDEAVEMALNLVQSKPKE
jgi:uncharacterized protein (TIGR00725 family)